MIDLDEIYKVHKGWLKAIIPCSPGQWDDSTTILELIEEIRRLHRMARDSKAAREAQRDLEWEVKQENTRAAGLEKAAEICRYHRDKFGDQVSAIWIAACNDIEASCLATAIRLRRGEYENPTSEVMQKTRSPE